MDYSEAQQAFFAPREGQVRSLDWSTPARRLRDAIEPLATVCFWSEPAYEAYAARGLDFLQGYVWGRASALGEPEPTLVAAAFGVFEPGLVADLYSMGRAACPLADVRAAKLAGAVAALREAIGEQPAGLSEAVSALRRAVEAAPALGRPFFAALQSLPWPDDLHGALWHACTMLREHRGDSHLAVLACAGLDGIEANILTELWVGWEPLSYTGSRAWSQQSMEVAVARLEARGLIANGALTPAGRQLREGLEASTDQQEQAVVEALGDAFDPLVERLDGWARQVVESGWFPPDPYKRAAG